MSTVEAYINSIEEGPRKDLFLQLRDVIASKLPKGFEETMNYGMIGYVVPHTLYPKGYHCSPELPLPFVNLVIRKDIITFYHMGLYADAAMLAWFETEYTKETGKKPDMGKSCMRFKYVDDIPYKLIGELVSKMTVKEWINTYEKVFNK